MLFECKAKDLERIYGVKDWTDYEDFLRLVALKKGRLLKGGEADLVAVAKLILFDW
jgi:nuclear GTP-binding protein